MRLETQREFEYLGALGGTSEDQRFVREMSRRLDALRRFDQHYSHADWRPSRSTPGRRGTRSTGSKSP